MSGGVVAGRYSGQRDVPRRLFRLRRLSDDDQDETIINEILHKVKIH